MKKDKYFLIGKNISYSLSPRIYKEMDYDYKIKDLNKDELAAFMEAKDFKGINVTIPYKKDVIKYLNEIDETAKAVGAVNTIVNKKGVLYGYNTDVFGLTALIKKSEVDFKDKTVLVLGSGGAAKTAVYVSNSLGAKKVVTISRNGKDNYNNIYWLYKDRADIIINATPVGRENFETKSVIDIDKFIKLEAFYDLNYAPLLTETAARANMQGVKAFGGLYMLVAQAVMAAKIYGTKEFKEDGRFNWALNDIYGELLFENRNFVLIGMPGSGKSSIGKLLAKKLNREFIDTDALIESKIGEPIQKFIIDNGEEKFREIEAEIVKDLENIKGKVIAVGGGTILREENVKILKENGAFIYLERELKKLTLKGRPLVSSDTVEDMFKKREALYNKYKDVAVKNNKGKGKTVQSILEIIHKI